MTTNKPLINMAGEPVCGLAMQATKVGSCGHTESIILYCTYPPDHPKIIDESGEAWDHGLIASPGRLWREES